MVDPLQLRLEGLSYRAIAVRVGVSAERIRQRLTPPPAIRRIVFERAEGRCQRCELRVGREGQIHHVAAGQMTCDEYNDLGNLVLLCRSCHRRCHRAGEEPALPRRGGPATAEYDGDRLARQIAARRQRLRLSQEQLAARARISRGYLVLVERGADVPSPAVLARIGRALRCSSAELSCVPAGR